VHLKKPGGVRYSEVLTHIGLLCSLTDLGRYIRTQLNVRHRWRLWVKLGTPLQKDNMAAFCRFTGVSYWNIPVVDHPG